MVAKITTPRSLKGALLYNELKVKKGVAKCLFAGNFLQQAGELGVAQKLERLQQLAGLNAAKTNALHISLNFYPGEYMGKEKLVAIAEHYMQGIGFAEQPYLVYEHLDAAHPHLHIVTTTIRPDGRRIDTYNIGRHASEKARKQIEIDFSLKRAGTLDRAVKPVPETGCVQRVRYSREPAKKSLSGVVDYVVSHYLYTSLAELNSVLKLYHVEADRGGAQSRVYRHGGLYYHQLDDRGNRVGVPLKASALYGRPTLPFLQKKFRQNGWVRPAFEGRLKTSIDWTLSKKPADIRAFTTGLQKENITAVFHSSREGFVYGVHFIDHRTGAVCKGSDLGKAYSAAGLQKQIEKDCRQAQSPPGNRLLPPQKKELNMGDGQVKNLWALLTRREQGTEELPADLRRRKHKGKRPT